MGTIEHQVTTNTNATAVTNEQQHKGNNTKKTMGKGGGKGGDVDCCEIMCLGGLAVCLFQMCCGSRGGQQAPGPGMYGPGMPQKQQGYPGNYGPPPPNYQGGQAGSPPPTAY